MNESSAKELDILSSRFVTVSIAGLLHANYREVLGAFSHCELAVRLVLVENVFVTLLT